MPINFSLDDIEDQEDLQQEEKGPFNETFPCEICKSATNTTQYYKKYYCPTHLKEEKKKRKREKSQSQSRSNIKNPPKQKETIKDSLISKFADAGISKFTFKNTDGAASINISLNLKDKKKTSKINDVLVGLLKDI